MGFMQVDGFRLSLDAGDVIPDAERSGRWPPDVRRAKEP